MLNATQPHLGVTGAYKKRCNRILTATPPNIFVLKLLPTVPPPPPPPLPARTLSDVRC